VETPKPVKEFDKVKIRQIAAGARHSLVLDHDGNIYAMGDNSEDQCAVPGRRAVEPEKILKDFKAAEIFSGDTHNVARSEAGQLYSWGGSVINQSWVNNNDSKLKVMEDFKTRSVGLVALAYSNTIVVTGQS